MPHQKDTVGGGVWRKNITLSPEDFEKLENAGNIHLNKTLKKSLEDALERYACNRDIYAASPDIDRVIKRAEDIRKASMKMKMFFQAENKKSNIDRALLARIKTVRPYWDEECDLSDAQFIFLNARLDMTIKKLSSMQRSKTGRGKDVFLDKILKDLMEIHNQARPRKNKVKNTGKLNFIIAALSLLPKRYKKYIQSDEAIKQRLKRLSKSHKK